MKDPYYRQILEGLAGRLDGQFFENSVSALLMDAYPSLVPVYGGGDGGMDGAIADGEGETFPLIVTTAHDVIGNLTRNLNSLLTSGRDRRRVVFATSQALTPLRRRNLEIRAREKGFTLVQIHDRRDIAGRLYRDSRQALDLLGITGEPPALSSLPESRRILREGLELRGRESDLQWLRDTVGDRLIVGQPGAGKTYLLSQLVQEGSALFLASEDERKVAEAYRDLKPKIILVDDAHADPDRLSRLRRWRAEIGGDFELVAATWPGGEDAVAQALGEIPSASVRRLELLTRKEILEILRDLGIREADDSPYLRQLVDQAANKPGLAVTLGSLWLRGEWRDVLRGEAMRRSLVPTLERLLGLDPSGLLACFGLGGDRGLEMKVVAEFLGISLEEIHRKVTIASQGGVLRVHKEVGLSVEPEALRSALLQKVFFTPPALSVEALLERVPHLADAAQTLVNSAVRGVEVPDALLRDLLPRAKATDAWRAYARLGESQAGWVLETYPEEFSRVALDVLPAAPEPAIRRLLEDAVRAEGPLHSQPLHPLRVLQEWMQEIVDSQGWVQESLRRRRQVVEEATSFLVDHPKDAGIARWAVSLALSPRFSSAKRTVAGDRVNFQWREFPSFALAPLGDLWQRGRKIFSEIDPESWRRLRESLLHWLRPSPESGEDKVEGLALRKAFAGRILTDLKPLAVGKVGLAVSMVDLAKKAGLHLEFDLDPDFRVLFPGDPIGKSYKEIRRKQLAKARELGQSWATKPPEEVVERLGGLQREARLWGHGSFGKVPEFWRGLAEEATAPEEFLAAVLGRSELCLGMKYLLDQIFIRPRSRWESLLIAALQTERYAQDVVGAVLSLGEPPADLLDLALTEADPRIVEDICSLKRVSLPLLRCLLDHSRQAVALAAAIGEWLCDPKGAVREEVRSRWHRVLAQANLEWVKEASSSSDAYWLQEIFRQDGDLAGAWLRGQMNRPVEEQVRLSAEEDLVQAAVSALDQMGRGFLLEELKDRPLTFEILPALIGSSSDLYHRLLGRHDLKKYHLLPLRGIFPAEGWIAMARIAIEAGYKAKDLAEVSLFGASPYVSFGVPHSQQWLEAFTELEGHDDPRMREVARHGVAIAGKGVDEAARARREAEITGRF